jgi:CRISPR type III-A-associated protein Csm2
MRGQTESPIETIVKNDDPEALVEEAKKLASQLKADEATKTQVRRLFGTLRQIEMSWPRQAEKPEEIQQRDDAYRELVLFGPRLAYQVDRHKALRPLAKAIQDGIKVVGKDRKRLQRLVQFFEATVAYYVAGPEKGGA